MRIALFISALLILISCKKENSVSIPIHADSYNWMMGSKTKYFVNQAGDSLVTDTFYSSIATIVEEQDDFEYTYNTYVETIMLDSVLEIQNTLEAKIQDNIRGDMLHIHGTALLISEDAAAVGIAANANVLDSLTAVYHDTLVLNNLIYTHLYSTTTNNKLILFVSPQHSIVGFAINTDTFNLVN